MKYLRFSATRSRFMPTIELFAGVEWPNGDLDIVQPVTLKREDADMFHQPFITLGREQAQNLMDELWNCGLRPSDGAGSAGQQAATEKHLADMRTIAFHKLGIK